MLLQFSGNPRLSIAQSPKAPQRPAELLKVERDSPVQVAELFRQLARPCDRIQLGTEEMIAIEPLGSDVLLDPEFAGTIMGQELPDGDKPGRQLELTLRQVPVPPLRTTSPGGGRQIRESLGPAAIAPAPNGLGKRAGYCAAIQSRHAGTSA